MKNESQTTSKLLRRFYDASTTLLRRFYDASGLWTLLRPFNSAQAIALTFELHSSLDWNKLTKIIPPNKIHNHQPPTKCHTVPNFEHLFAPPFSSITTDQSLFCLANNLFVFFPFKSQISFCTSVIRQSESYEELASRPICNYDTRILPAQITRKV